MPGNVAANEHVFDGGPVGVAAGLGASTPVETIHDRGELDDIRVVAALTIQRLFRRRHAKKQFRAMLESVFAKFYDEESGKHYYHNKRTGETTWEKPRLLKGDEDIAVAGVYEGGDAVDTCGSKLDDCTKLEDVGCEESASRGSDEKTEGEDQEDETVEDEEDGVDDGEEHDGMGYTLHERELAKKQFDYYDTDKSGSISAKELLTLMQTLGEQLTLKNVEEMIQQVDANGNGDVDFDEFLQILRRQKDRNQYAASLELALLFGPKELDNLKRQFMKLDLDGSGSIEEHEIQALIKKLGRKVEEFDLRAILAEVDADGSGSIGFNEFLQIVAGMMKEGGKRSGFATLLDLGIAQGVLNELNDAIKASRTLVYEWWNADLIAEQKRLAAKREKRRKLEEERRRQLEIDRAAYEAYEAQLAAERAARMVQVEGLKIEVQFQGNGLNYPVPGHYVRVHYVGMFGKSGAIFESTRKRGGALEFCVGAGHLIKGFDFAVQRMSVGETAKVTMAPMLAYGVKGRLPKIPPNATLVFKIELISIKEKFHLVQDLNGADDD